VNGRFLTVLRERLHVHFATEDKGLEHYYFANDMQYLKPLEYMEKTVEGSVITAY
jgi:hypothetical protein